MARNLTRVDAVNYRCLQNVSVELGDVTVLFGPNGAGKSTFLDTLWFVRDCAVRGVETASASRNYGLGLRWDKAAEDAPVEVGLSIADAFYSVRVGFSAGRMDPYAGEQLRGADESVLIDRHVGSPQAEFRNYGTGELFASTLRDPTTLSLGRFLDFDARFEEAVQLDSLLRTIHYYHSRSFNLYKLRVDGSDAGYDYYLSSRADNLFSVLRNLQSRSAIDGRYERVMAWMKRAFPGFLGLVLEPRGQGGVYGSFAHDGHEPVAASGLADGHLQLLIVLTALYGGEQVSTVLLDEPDLSLHPWALATLADACFDAASKYGRQVLIATHSPVLLSQFDSEQVVAFGQQDGATQARRVSEMHESQDLLDQFALGSLYMAMAIAPQGDPDAEPEVLL
jgi:predicted ATPase